MAILINEAFPDEDANGVTVTLPGPPITVLVNAQPGDALVTNPTADQIPESWRIGRRQELVSRSSIGAVFADRPDRAPLLLQLVADTRAIHDALVGDRADFGVDIEWKVTSGRLYLKQARLLGALQPE